MTFFEALAQGASPWGLPTRIHETAISKLFFFSDKVVKVYKPQHYFFADLENLQSRKKFFQDDFFWNHTASPDIYTTLGGVRIDSRVHLVDFDEGEDFYILMNIIDGTQTLTHLLQTHAITPHDMARMTSSLTNLLRTLTKEKITSFKHYTSLGWHQLWKLDELESLRSWLRMAPPHITDDEIDRIMNLLEKASLSHSYFHNYDPAFFTVVMDNNSDNLLFLHGKPSFIDMMPPKEGWRIADEYAVVVRTAVDGYVLGGKEYGDAVYWTYAHYRDAAPSRITLLYEIRAALIQWPLRHIMNQHELACLYKQFMLRKAEELARAV